MFVGGAESYWYAFPLMAILAWALVIPVYRFAPSRGANRSLALLLLVTGFMLGSLSMFMLQEPRAVLGTTLVESLGAVHRTAMAALPWLYLVFVGQAIRVPSTRWLAHPTTVKVLLALAAAAPLVWLVNLGIDYGRTTWYNIYESNLILMGATGLIGILAGIQQVRATQAGTPQRRRATAYLAAFGFRDLAWVIGIVWMLIVNIGRALVGFQPPSLNLFNWTVSAGLFLYLVLLAYGILSTQSLEFDLRLRFTIKQSTVAAVFLAVFFTVGLAASEFLVDSLGYGVGALVAGALFLVFRPLQNLGERVAAFAVPQAQPLSAMSLAHKRIVYRDQAELAWADGVMSARERDILDAARERLGLDANEATQIEKRVRAGVA